MDKVRFFVEKYVDRKTRGIVEWSQTGGECSGDFCAVDKWLKSVDKLGISCGKIV